MQKSWARVLFTGLLLSEVVLAQPAVPAKTEPQATVEPRSAPGPTHAYLARYAGEWDVAKTFYGRDGQVSKQTGTCTQTMIHGGRFLRSEFRFNSPTGETTGTGIIGFDSATGKFTTTWIDSRATRISHRESDKPFNNEEIKLKGVALGGPPSRQSQTVTRLEADDNRIVHRQYSLDDQGDERLVMELVLTRRSPVVPK